MKGRGGGGERGRGRGGRGGGERVGRRAEGGRGRGGEGERGERGRGGEGERETYFLNFASISMSISFEACHHMLLCLYPSSLRSLFPNQKSYTFSVISSPFAPFL